MRREERDAVGHYLTCKSCRDAGLARITEKDLSCHEAVLVWAESATPLWLACSPHQFMIAETLIEHYATEHVWGRYEWKNSRGGNGWNTSLSCSERPCRVLHDYWANIPLSSSAGNGAQGRIHLFPFILQEIFLKEGWSLDKLLKIQQGRVTTLLKEIKRQRIPIGCGRYDSTDEIFAEIEQHIEALQQVALHTPPR
jgi:hypothetical protein